MSTKECPSCGAEVPGSATRCKQCFHDFTEAPEKTFSLAGPLIVLASLAAMAVVGSLVLLFIFVQPVEQHTLVDASTRSIVWTTKYRTGIQTDRLMFDQVAKVEHSGASGTFQVIAITTDGERKVISEGDSPLDSEGRAYASMMDKPFEDVDPAAALLHHKP
ncbi:MAG: hypothetical protein ABMB14_26885 [Myxococcota bacterium]